MMESIRKIWAVAFYEAKLILRTKNFRLLPLFSLVAFGWIHLYISRLWVLHGMPSMHPYCSLIVFNFIQSFFIIFAAPRFLTEEHDLDTAEVIYSHSFANVSYFFGKTLGVLAVFTLSTLIYLLFAYGVAFLSMSDVTVQFSHYLYYALLIPLPTLVFLTGLSILCISIVRSRAAALVIMNFFVVVSLIFTLNVGHNIFDFRAINIPLLYSGFIGFGNFRIMIMQRLVVVLLGAAFFSASVPLFSRLRQSGITVPVSMTAAVLGIGVACWFGVQYMDHFDRGITLRSDIRVLNRQHAGAPLVTVTGCTIDLIHAGDTIEIETQVVFINDNGTPLETMLFSLNPGLKIDEITRNGKHIEFGRNLHLVTVKPLTPLLPGSVDSLLFRYRGGIDEDACYADIDESFRRRINKNFLTTIDKRYGFVTPDYVLLTRENLWYPVPGAWGEFNDEQMHGKSFIRYALTVTTRDGLIPVSQGAEKILDSRTRRFTPEYPLPQISLVIGKYTRLALSHEGIDYSLYHLDGNDYFMQKLSGMKEEHIRKQINELHNYFELRMSLSYPFRRFSIVEVPVQFLSHYRPMFLQSESLQPEQVFLPERGILIPSHKADLKRTEKYRSMFARYHPLRYDGIKSYVLGGTLLSIFSDMYPVGLSFIAREIAREKRMLTSAKLFAHIQPSFLYNYNLYPMFYTFSSDFSSEKYPLFDLLMGNYMRLRMSRGSDTIGVNSIRVNRSIITKDMMTQKTLSEWLYSGEKRFAISELMTFKAEELFKTIEYFSGKDSIEPFVNEYVVSHRYKPKTGDDFIASLESRFDINYQKYYDQITDISDFPFFIVSDVKREKVIVSDTRNRKSNEVYRVNLSIYNKGSDGGIISCYKSGITMSVYLDAQQAKRVGFIVDTFSSPYIHFKTYNARNKKISRIFVMDETMRDSDDFIIGEVIIDPPPPEPGIIVDDNDPGFSIIDNGKKNLLIRLFDLDRTSEYEFYYYNVKKIPVRWTQALDECENLPTDFYSRLMTTVHYVKSGKGTKKVQWETDIPERGKYDVLFYTPQNKKFNLWSFEGASSAVKDFHFTVNHDDGASELIEDVSRNKDRWLNLGTFYFSKGPASVILSDESKGKLVYADAVKWVKK